MFVLRPASKLDFQRPLIQHETNEHQRGSARLHSSFGLPRTRTESHWLCNTIDGADAFLGRGSWAARAAPLLTRINSTFDNMEERVSLRPIKTDDLPVFFVHQLDPEATKLAAFPSRDREAFFTHWTTKILGNPATLNRTILAGDQVAGYVGAWTDAASGDRLLCYWIGREFWGRGIASAALTQFLRLESTRPIGAHVAKHNLGSIRVLEKKGFARVGEDRCSLPNGAPAEEYIYFLAA